MSVQFNSSPEPTIGVEIEIQLIDKDHLDLAQKSNEIIEKLPPPFKESVKYELMQSNIEINTKICRNISEVEEDLRKKFELVRKIADSLNIELCCAGTHPFANWREQVITSDKRYLRLLEVLQIVIRRFNIFGLHVHIGVDDPEKAIWVMGRLLLYLPHLLSLSSNSPFWQGSNTGLMSYRTKIFESLPTAGMPFYFKNWQEYETLVEHFIDTKTIETIREIWWDIRPHPDFGTLEVRICDALPSIKETVAIAGLVQTLVVKLGEDYKKRETFPLPHLSIIRQNRWRAARFGLRGELIDPFTYKVVTAEKAIDYLLNDLAPTAKVLNTTPCFDIISNIMENGSGAEKQLKVYDETGDLKEVVKYLINQLKSA